jgi:16S rRNA (guanine966-N2)-methyltransferase
MIFNVLLHRYFLGNDFLSNIAVVDVFSGSGALGIEALSRGAPSVLFVEKNQKTVQKLSGFLSQNNLFNQCSVWQGDALCLPPPDQVTQHLSFLKSSNYGLLEKGRKLFFLDPPYGKNLTVPALEQLKTQDWVSSDSLMVTEADVREEVIFPNWLTIDFEKRQGRTRVFFLYSHSKEIL